MAFVDFVEASWEHVRVSEVPMNVIGPAGRLP